MHVLVNNAGANFMGVEPWFTEQGVAGLPQVRNVGGWEKGEAQERGRGPR